MFSSFLRRSLRSSTIRRRIVVGGLSSSALLFLPVWSNRPFDSELVHRKRSYSSLLDLWNDFFVDGWSEGLGRLQSFSCTSPSVNSGVARIDSASMVSRVRGQLNVDVFAPRIPALEWTLLGIFNGNSGRSTSEHLHENLLTAITGFLADVYSSYNRVDPDYYEVTASDSEENPGERVYPPSEKIDEAITNAFQRVDNDIVHDAVERVFSQNSKEAATALLSPATSGSSAILAFFDGRENLLKVAVAGGAGAVLGRRVEHSGKFNDVKYQADVITTPQPTFKHPKTGEQMFVRSFGNAIFKWSAETQRRLYENFLGDVPVPESLHPKVTAEPFISTIKIRPGDFVVIANSGVWDCLSSEDAVGLVAAWLKRNQLREEEAHVEVLKLNENTQVTYKVYKPSHRDSRVTLHPEDFPVVRKKSSQSCPAAKTDKNLNWIPKGGERKFINIDSNAASHIIRNAVGGANTDLVQAFENMDPVRVEKLRDDLGVQVIFFK